MTQISPNRQHSRYPVEMSVLFKPLSPEEVLWEMAGQSWDSDCPGTALNISAEGMALSTPEALKQGELVRIRLKQRKDHALALARVAWCQPDMGGPGYISGMRFLNLYWDRDRENLLAFLKKSQTNLDFGSK